MTLGKKLSNYRRVLGLTQQQLGEKLNLSAQAISKWENDLAEPDLTTLKILANLYKVSIDELLDMNSSVAGASVDAEAVADAINEKIKSTPQTIGFCKICGIAVTEENLGESDPVIKCKKCVKAERDIEIRAAEKRKRDREEAAKRAQVAFRATQSSIKRVRLRSLIVAGLIAVPLLILFLIGVFADFSIGDLFLAIALSGCVFCFVSMLFYDTPVTHVIVNMCTASIKWPGIIFTFDLDGFLWLIGMKLLFAVIGFVFGLICTVLGLIIGFIIAPFVFVYIMIKMHFDIKRGVEGDYLW